MSEILALTGDDRRDIVERRQFSWRTVLYGFARSRRRELRRNADADVALIDWHHPWLFFLAVGTMLLSCADAFLTLILIDNGMYEANPLMAGAMAEGVGLFVASKMALTGTGILLLVFLAKTQFLNRIRTGLILTSFFSLYCCLVCYEIVSLLRSI
jgi:hypothetical protein